MSGIGAIGERLRTQDNRCTAEPMFCVQEFHKDIGYDADYTDDVVWIDMSNGESEEVEPESPGAEKFGYKERWETVMVAFTEAGCNEYIRLNGHNHSGKLRIFTESFRRCPEMIAIREMLMRKPPDFDAALKKAWKAYEDKHSYSEFASGFRAGFDAGRGVAK